MKRGLFGGKNCKVGALLFPTVIFIVLNIMIFGALLIFVLRTASGAAVYEQTYVKQIVLLLDSAEPVMEIKLNMEEGMKIAEKNEMYFHDIVKIEDNIVTVKLSKGGGYSYSFFNELDVTAYPDVPNKNYIIKVNA